MSKKFMVYPYMIFVIVELIFKKKGIQIIMIILDKSFKELFKDFFVQQII